MRDALLFIPSAKSEDASAVSKTSGKAQTKSSLMRSSTRPSMPARVVRLACGRKIRWLQASDAAAAREKKSRSAVRRSSGSGSSSGPAQCQSVTHGSRRRHFSGLKRERERARERDKKKKKEKEKMKKQKFKSSNKNSKIQKFKNKNKKKAKEREPKRGRLFEMCVKNRGR